MCWPIGGAPACIFPCIDQKEERLPVYSHVLANRRSTCVQQRLLRTSLVSQVCLADEPTQEEA
eukprot:3867384-Pyramimonas_sp.AAC.1